MTRLYDGNRLISIEVRTWTGSGYTPDWSNDLFEVGGLPYDDARDAYIVPDVAYCVDVAESWGAEAPDNMCLIQDYNPETGALLPEIDLD